MKQPSKKTLFLAIVVLLVVICVLVVLPIGALKMQLKHHILWLEKARLYFEDATGISITFQLIQNVLHVPFFGFFAYLVMLFLRRSGVAFKRAAIITAVIIFLFSAGTEAVQFFIGRDASVGDLVLDMIGCGLGVWCAKKQGLGYRV